MAGPDPGWSCQRRSHKGWGRRSDWASREDLFASTLGFPEAGGLKIRAGRGERYVCLCLGTRAQLPRPRASRAAACSDRFQQPWAPSPLSLSRSSGGGARDPLGRVCVCRSGGRARLPHQRALRDQTRPERRSLLLRRTQAGAARRDFNPGHAAVPSSSFRDPHPRPDPAKYPSAQP